MKAIIAVPATLALMYRAWSHKSLTPAGIFAAGLTAAAHAYHPWNLPFVLLVVFFLSGTRVTKIKKDVKATLTVASKGGTSGGEGPRTHIQVFANSIVASVLSILHARQLEQRRKTVMEGSAPTGSFCYAWGGDLLVVGIIANYAAVAADTFSSELGILSKSQPRLITSPTLRRVPPGTNGGVTLMGIAAGFFGSLLIVTTSMVFLPLCKDSKDNILGVGEITGSWTDERRRIFMSGLIIWGTLGSLLDSILGAVFQRSVKDVRSGKIVEGEGGTRVLVTAESDTLKRVAVKSAALHGEGRGAVENTDASTATESGKNPESHNRYDPHDKHRVSTFGDKRPTRVVESGLNLLDNNDVNFLMALTMSVGGMAIAGHYWGIPLDSILSP